MGVTHRTGTLLVHAEHDSCATAAATSELPKQESTAMNFAFYVIFRESGMFLFASNILSECLDFAQSHKRVEIVDTFGQVWGAN